ncbi:glycoside hydrolase family 16 protein [Polyporus arcularius HHB13444]|uniref:Glycoside hydrolase family 16 protein n=1 Tax=Polyporus arcularius HHB13444 TaxID=1314778 RepID=A0A5C3P4S1_9APHY|nr:glycoside hydrolase family 16 protein [Polyporus arcularius HHB13444]
MPAPNLPSSSSSSASSSSSSSPRPSTSAEHSSDAHQTGFFIPDHAEPDSPGDESRDPFSTPSASLPSSPKPASVVSFSGFADRPLNKRYDSRVSVQSALRKSTTDIEELGASSSARSQARNSFMPPRLMRPALPTSPKATSRMSTMSRVRKPMRSTMLTGAIEKPWLSQKDKMAILSHWVVYLIALLGIAGGAIRCYFTWKTTLRLGNLCLVMEDNFDTFDTENTWTHEVSMSGFG